MAINHKHLQQTRGDGNAAADDMMDYATYTDVADKKEVARPDDQQQQILDMNCTQTDMTMSEAQGTHANQSGIQNMQMDLEFHERDLEQLNYNQMRLYLVKCIYHFTK